MRRRILSALLGLMLLPLPSRSETEPAGGGERRITVIFRFDDYSARSDTDLEVRILDAFRARGLRCTIGVIPKVAAHSVSSPAPQPGLLLPAAKIRILSEALRNGTLEVAQHGFVHQIARF